MQLGSPRTPCFELDNLGQHDQNLVGIYNIHKLEVVRAPI
jgi:hypothetical protein